MKPLLAFTFVFECAPIILAVSPYIPTELAPFTAIVPLFINSKVLSVESNVPFFIFLSVPYSCKVFAEVNPAIPTPVFVTDIFPLLLFISLEPFIP